MSKNKCKGQSIACCCSGTVSMSDTGGVKEDTVLLSSHIFLPRLCFFSSPLVLTSADTDQVASSLWVSMGPSNRKQVRPGAPAVMLNVAAREEINAEPCFDGVRRHQLKPGREAQEVVLLRVLRFSVWGVWVRVVVVSADVQKLSGVYVLKVVRALMTGAL